MTDVEFPQWRFAQMAPSQINQNPIQGEFFTSVSDLPERVVRESIQNSLDARRHGETIRVRFVLSGSEKALNATSASAWVDGLTRHVEAVTLTESHKRSDDEQDALVEAHRLLEGPMSYLVVEDFGTTGLIGDVEANSEYEEDNAFWGFFRSIGISPKGADAGGSWGLGKWVFPDASRINSFIGLTRRDGESACLLMGQAMLQTHTIADADGSAKYPPYGFFAASSNHPDSEWLPMPVDSAEAAEIVERLISDFKLERNAGSGLSVVVPHPKDELTAESIARAVAVQWFLPILRGDLEVEIEAPDASYFITRETINSVVHGFHDEMEDSEQRRDDETRASLHGLLQLAAWALQHPRTDIPEIDLSRNTSSVADVIDENMRAKFDRGDRLAFRVLVRVREQGQSLRSATVNAFHVFLERDDAISEGHDYFVRGHLRIPQMDHVRRYPVRALVLVEANTALAHLLRDAEGPAHTKWDPHADRLKQHWSGGYQRVQDVRRAALLLVQQLTKRPEGRQLDVLARFFPDTLPDETRRSRSKKTEQGDDSDKPVIPELPRSPLQVSRLSDGFVLRHHPSDRTNAPNTDQKSGWRVRFAYDVARRNALSEFDKGHRDGAPDFDLRDGKLLVQAESAQFEIAGPNTLDVTVLNPDFRLGVLGFDGRDVLVEVKPLSPSEMLSGVAAG